MAELTITHTHADGTVLTGSTKNDGVLDIVRRHGFQWRRNAGIHVPHSRDHRAKTWLINAAVAALEAAGHTVTLDIDDAYRPAAEVAADQVERATGRAGRYAELAASAAASSRAAGQASDRIAGMRPFGQPILVGHHSEGRARRDQARIHSLEERRWAEADRSAHYTHRAQAALATAAHQHHGPAVMRRIEKHQAERRGWERRLAEATSDSAKTSYQEELDHLDDMIAFDRAVLAELEAAGTFVQWRREHFQPGDQVRIWGHLWLTVKRVNTKSVSVVDDLGYTRPVPWDDLSGRRRDGQQLDTPNGQPWPVATALKVAAWTQLARSAATSTSYDSDATWHRYRVATARRLVHGLPSDASDAEVDAFEPADTDVASWRALAVACLDVYDRLTAGQSAEYIAVMITPMGAAAWTFPDGDPTDVRAPHVRPGDLVKGIWDRGGPSGRQLWRHFAGPVASVSDVDNRGERGDWVTITLVGGAVRELQTHQWLAVYPATTPIAIKTIA